MRRIVLPSGKTIEVLRLAEEQELGHELEAMLGPAPTPVAPTGPGPGSGDGSGDGSSHGSGSGSGSGDGSGEPVGATAVATDEPHLCGRCASTLVYPVAWTAAGSERWRVELRCPNCERTASVLLDLDVAEQFDDELERGAETLMSDLARLTEANMLDALDRLTAALAVDAVLPADF